MFCKNCNKEISIDSLYCSFCGEKIIAIENKLLANAENEISVECDAIEENENTIFEKVQNEKSPKKKYILFLLLSVFVVIAIVFIGLYFWSNRIIKQDINVINGCPEVYNLEFGMSVNEVSNLLEFEHTKYFAGQDKESWLDTTDDSMIMASGDIDYDIYGIPIQSVLFDFNRYDFDGVMLFISKDDIEINELVKLYTQIYGQPTVRNDLDCVWEGPNVQIAVFNAKTQGSDDDTLVVYYRALNLNFKEFVFTGPEIDPLQIRYKILYSYYPDIIEELNEGKDYKVEEYNTEGFEGFTKYTLYPDFQYMGMEQGNTVVQFDVGEEDYKVDVASYSFFLTENAVDEIRHIKSRLDEEYGMCKKCEYSSTYYEEIGNKNITFKEMLTKIGNNEQGMYFIYWESYSGMSITFSLFKTPEYEYYQGKVSYS